jgi:5-methyltetrahydropteroyltriglutamate--homocysteine methyltransferase
VSIIAAHNGSYPRIGDTSERQALRRALEAFQKGAIKAAELDRIRQGVIREAIGEQVKAGLDVVSDGHIRWYDAVSHPMGKLGGVTINGLLRFYDTNTYFRQPVITGTVAGKDPIIADEIRWAVAVSPRPVVATLLGPLTLSRLSILKGGPYRSPAALFDALVPVLAAEVERLVRAGADAVVIEEPHLLKEPAALPRLADALEVLAAKRGGKRLWLFPSFGEAAPLYDQLQRLSVDGLKLDVTYGRATADAIESGGSRLALALGIVDARNTRLESPAAVARQAERLFRRAKGPVQALTASNGLEYLPRDRAAQKCAVLAKARDLLNGKGARGRAKPKPKSTPKPAKRKTVRAKRKPARRAGQGGA